MSTPKTRKRRERHAAERRAFRERRGDGDWFENVLGARWLGDVSVTITRAGQIGECRVSYSIDDGRNFGTSLVLEHDSQGGTMANFRKAVDDCNAEIVRIICGPSEDVKP